MLVTIGTKFGLGRPKDSIHDSGYLENAIKYTVIAPALSVVSTTFGKLSALTLLVRLMGIAAERWHLMVLWAICGIKVMLNIFAVILIVGFCYPAAKQWNPSIDGWCMSPDVQYGRSFSSTGQQAWDKYNSSANSESFARLAGGYTSAAYNALMDMIVATAPSPLIRKLKVSRTTKLGLCLMMGGG